MVLENHIMSKNDKKSLVLSMNSLQAFAICQDLEILCIS